MEISAGDIAVELSGTTLADRPELAGTVESDEVVELALSSPVKLQIRIARVEKGTLDFSWRVMDPPGKAGIEYVSVYGLGDFFCDAEYRTDGLGERGPDHAHRLPLIDPDLGTRIDFGWSKSPLDVPSYFFFASTNATAFAEGGLIAVSCGDGSAVAVPGPRAVKA